MVSWQWRNGGNQSSWELSTMGPLWSNHETKGQMKNTQWKTFGGPFCSGPFVFELRCPKLHYPIVA